MEVYAGFLENADWNVGRLLDAIEEMGELDNTLVIYIFGDNGASMEGTITGTFNELTMQNGIALSPSSSSRSSRTTAASTPGAPTRSRRTTRQLGRGPATRRSSGGSRCASHLGGTRNPMVVSWPERITDPGGFRAQFTHCIDIGPTILEAAGIPEPKVVDGIEQKPMEGTSFLYSFDDAEAAERHTVQYFEMFGNRAIYKDGWWAACKLDRIPWDASPPSIARFAPASTTRSRTRGSSTTYPTTSRRRRISPRAAGEAGGAQGALLAGSREAQRAAAARGLLGLLRDPPANADDHTQRSTATSRTSRPA